MIASAGRLLKEGGPEAVTHSAVAECSGIGRTTLYRHWPNRGALMIDVLATLQAEWVSALTDDPRVDLIAALTSMVEMLAEQQTCIRMLTLMERAQHDDQAADTLRRMESGSPIRVVLMRGIESGLLPANLDIDAALSQLIGPVLHARLVARRDVSAGEIERLADQILDRPSTVDHR